MDINTLKEELVAAIRHYALQRIAGSPGVRNGHASELEGIVRERFNEFETKERETEGYNPRHEGPVLSDGRSYKAYRIFPMDTERFQRLHRKLPDGHHALNRYIKRAVEVITSGARRKTVTMREVIAMDPSLVKGQNVKHKTIGRVRRFFDNNYTIELGRDYGFPKS